jgi:hypothetical protein
MQTASAYDTAFRLVAPMYHVPVGATGQLKRLDSDHVALIFDAHEDLVLDVHDTEPEVWAAIQKRKPPRSPHLAWAAAILIAFAVGWTIEDPASAAIATYMEQNIYP